MSSRAEICAHLMRHVLIAVVRTNQPNQVPFICEALLKGGIKTIEITFTIPEALRLIEKVSKDFGRDGLIGAGTVLDLQTGSAALTAGAQFIVSPVARVGLVEVAHSAGKPVMLGAYTPTEAQVAHESGADFIKIFPADKLGPSYIKALRAPLAHLKIVPTGGVDLQTLPKFLDAGCVALGLGSALITREILQNNDWVGLSQLAKQFVQESTRCR